MQFVLAGVAERRMAQIVRQGDGFGQVDVEVQRMGQGPGDLRHFQRVRQPGAEVIAFIGDEHLGLAFQTSEGGRVDDPVTVAREGGAGRAFRFGMQPSLELGDVFGVAGQGHVGVNLL